MKFNLILFGSLTAILFLLYLSIRFILFTNVYSERKYDIATKKMIVYPIFKLQNINNVSASSIINKLYAPELRLEKWFLRRNVPDTDRYYLSLMNSIERARRWNDVPINATYVILFEREFHFFNKDDKFVGRIFP